MIVVASTFSNNSLRQLQVKQFKVVQGHRSWCQWKAHVRLPISD